jgi:membrane-associated protein
MQFIQLFLDFVLHLDVHLTELVIQYGIATYGFLFFVIFAETGFVITPFLPGDSLLFAAGAIAALGGLRIETLLTVLAIAAIIGDTVNYWIGHFFGRALVANPKIPIRQEHIDKTEAFYKKYGGKTIILARFVPIVRTFAPFVAGIGTMEYKKFILYNIVGGIVWVFLFTFAGYFFGNFPFVKHNFLYVVFMIVGISILPMIYEYLKSRRHTS